jgi:3-hydroxybutyryl-CoA dehydrogenase
MSVSPGTTPSRVDDVVIVVGGGTMGAGIAQAMLGIVGHVTVAEADLAAGEAALGRVRAGLERLFRHDDDPESEVVASMARLDVSIGLPADADPALVIEAVPESVDAKRSVFADVEAAYPDLPLLATNTSSLSITELGSDLARPERFIGMHFFNPVPVSELVELVLGRATAESTTAAAREWIDALAKHAIVVQDSPGFATSRLGLALGLEAIRMVEAGVASVDDIDTGMVLGYKHPIGPLRLTDLIGLDVRLGIAEHLAATLGPRFEPPDLLRRMVADGKLGKKSGEGFHVWS